MSRQKYSYTISNRNTGNPDFETCVQFIFAFKLTRSEAEELLRVAGKALSDDPYHRIVRYFIENQCYDIFELNAALAQYAINPIGVR